MQAHSRLSRRQILGSAAALGAALAVPGRAPAQDGAKPFAGTTLNVSCWSAPFPKLLGEYLPEFTEQTGIAVNYDTPAFGVYNQRVDLELSTQGQAYDVLNVTFIYVSRWIGAGWFTPLDDFIADPSRTPADFDVEDFLPGLRTIMQDKDGRLYGIPWTADCYIACAARSDLMAQAGVAMPETFEDIERVAAAVHGKEGVAGFLNDNRHGWSWIPYLQGFGGNVFRAPPDDLMPALDTPEAIAAADFYSRMLREYGPDGVLSYTYDQLTQTLKQGRGNYATHGHIFLTPVAAADSKAAATVRYSLFPTGPAGRFPGLATHAWGIPVGSKNKEAAWEFIKWAMSKDLMTRAMVEKGYSSPTRRSLIDSPTFRQSMMLNGNDVADLYLKTIEIAAAGGYMAYRTVHVFPQVDALIGKAIEQITSEQATPAAAMRAAQQNAIAELKRAGVEL